MNPSPKACEAANKYLVNANLPNDVKERATLLVALVLAEAGESLDQARKALDFLKRAAAENCRVVSSGDLTHHQIVEAQTSGRFYIEPGMNGGLGWALLPWDLTTEKDRRREADYFSRNNMMA